MAGVGRALLAHVLHVARGQPSLRDTTDRIELHVHAANDEALVSDRFPSMPAVYP